MAVSCYFGLTESGKSYHVQNHVIPLLKKTIVFDNALCFKGETVITDPTNMDLIKLWRKLLNKDRFSIVIRPSRNCDVINLADKVINLALNVGRTAQVGRKEKVPIEDRVNLIIDEADFICSSHFQSKSLKRLVNKGRHDHVDSHFIARIPMRIHGDIRSNATKIVSFFLPNAREIPYFREAFGAEISAKIKELPKYHRLEWTDREGVKLYNEKNKAYSR